MTARADLANTFLRGTDWANATRNSLAGDASNRRYERLSQSNGQTAVFMDAPPDKGEDVRPFVAIAKHLTGLGLSAPEVIAEDAEHGFLILEDLGDDLFARVVHAQPALEQTLYEAATDALVHLHQSPIPDLPKYDAKVMTEYAATAFTRYKAGITGTIDDNETAQFAKAFEPLLAQLTDGAGVLVQRDYHAENLLWLADRRGIARVGMLDFQDAMLGHPAYDLVSILQDARRDVPPGLEDLMIRRYLSQTHADPGTFRAAYAALGAQRNLRILGVFAKLSLDMGKAHYVDLIPRVWDLLQRDLDHPALKAIAKMVRTTLPQPTATNLERLRPA